MTTQLTPSEVAEQFDVPAETLRYWERAGLLPRVGRDGTRRRRYSDADLGYIDLVRCLRVTGMTIRQVRTFTDLVRDGEHTEPARLALLREHRARVVADIEAQRMALDHIDGKIAYLEGDR